MTQGLSGAVATPEEALGVAQRLHLLLEQEFDALRGQEARAIDQRRIVAYHAHIDYVKSHAHKHAVNGVAVAVEYLALFER